MLGFLTVLSSLVNTTTLSCKNEDKCSSCILYIVLFSIFFTVGIVAYFVHFKCMNRNKESVSKYDYIYLAKNYYDKWEK